MVYITYPSEKADILTSRNEEYAVKGRDSVYSSHACHIEHSHARSTTTGSRWRSRLSTSTRTIELRLKDPIHISAQDAQRTR